jgi:endo-1,4-beta-xylanase
MDMISRQGNILQGIAAMLFLAGVSAGLQGSVFAQSDTIQTTVPSLKAVFAGDFFIGCLLSYRNVGFADDPPVPGQSAVITPNGGYLIRFHMNSMSPGNNMKPQYTVDLAGSAAAYTAAASAGEKDSVDIHPIVRFNGDIIAQLNWARRQGFTFRGHTLVWHSQTPGTAFFRTGYAAGGTRLTKERMTQRMEFYIKEVIRLIHEGWPGLLTAFDVVNEAVNENGSDRTTDSEWYTTFGDNSYVHKAFELARKYTVQYGESQIKLYYNDYNTHNATKASGIARLCSPIFRAGILDGIGMQEHDGNSYPTAPEWIASYAKFDTVCTEMAVTELDVATGSSTPSPAALTTQANQYGQLFKCFIERSKRSGRGKIISVSKDGLNDQYTFVAQATSLWDAQNKCKPAFYAVVNVGINYRQLDSLVRYAGSLHEASYTPASWEKLAAALASGQSAMSRNYSASLSAADGLGLARDSLRNALGALTLVDVAAGSEESPGEFLLLQNYPNPFNPVTTVQYSVAQAGGQGPAASRVKLGVYDMLGREAAVLVDELRSPGTHTVRFDASGLPSGVYLYRLTAGSRVESRRMVLMK